MKKLLSILLVCLSLLLLVFIGVNTKALEAPSMVNGASIRTSGEHQGLKFSASVTSLEGVVEHGFFVAKGTHTKEAIVEAFEASESTVGENKLLKKTVEGTDLEFHLVVYNINSNNYNQNITALAYVYNGSSYTYAAAAVSRNILTIAEAAMEDLEYEPNEFIERIVCTSTFVLNGGSFAFSYKFTITGDADAGSNLSNSGTTLNIGSKSNYNKTCNSYWTRIYVNRDSETGCYKIIGTGTAPDNYEYVIAVHSSCNDTVSKTSLQALAADANKGDYYLKIDIPAVHNSSCNIEVLVDRNYEILSNQKTFLAPDETLPGATKPYYDFAGWYNEIDFSGSVKTKKEGDLAETFYAKWTPTNYTLSFDLQGGKSGGETSIDDVNFNVQSSEIVLPLAGTMSKTDYTFVEWNTRSDGTGDTITSIPAGSHSNVTVYAIWAADAPVDVELSAADTAALALITPTKYVKSDFTAGRFNVNGNVCEAGVEAFATVAAALAAASEDDVIYVFAGTYASDITISTPGVSLVGPNYNISGTDSRADEAIVNGSITVLSDNVTLNGIRLTGTSHTIYLGYKDTETPANSIAVSNISILNLTSNATGKGTQGGRTAIIGSDFTVTNLVISNVYITCNASAGRTAIALYGTVNGFTLNDSFISNTASSAVGGEVARITNISGAINIKNNEFEWSSSSYSLIMGSSTNSSTGVTIANNYIYGKSSAKSATIFVGKMAASKELNIIGNHLKYVSGNIMDFSSSSGTSKIYISYNLFDTGVSYKITNKGSGTITYTKNRYEDAQTTATSDVSAIASKAALITAYKGSAEYTTYGSICVYED